MQDGSVHLDKMGEESTENKVEPLRAPVLLNRVIVEFQKNCEIL